MIKSFNEMNKTGLGEDPFVHWFNQEPNYEGMA